MAAEGGEFDRVALLQPTTPLRVSQRWDEAAAYIDAGAPAALGVRGAPSHPYWSLFMGADAALVSCFPQEVARRSQDLPPAYVPNGSLYLCRLNELRRHRSLTPPGTRGVICDDPLESIDIDTEQDWRNAERAIKATGQ
jgi:CMP-N-acetylneuraminic acid synthetase